MVFNIQDFKSTWTPNSNNGLSFTKNYTPYLDITVGEQTAQMYAQLDYSIPCGTMHSLVSKNVLQSDADWNNINFNKIALHSRKLSPAPDLTMSGTTQCTSYTLKASSFDLSMASYTHWKDNTSTVISTSPTVTVTATGTYTFEVLTTNGCLITKTITI
jgi:hypothetical protein